MRDRLVPALLVAALLVFLQFRSGVEPGILAVAAMALFAYVTLAGGRLLAAAARLRDGDPSSAWVLGLLAMCLVTYGFASLLQVTAGAVFAVVTLVVIGTEVALRRRPFPHADRKALVGFALAVALTAAWCSEPAGAYQVVRTQGVLPLWVDYFFHGGVISQLGDVRALGRGSIYLADHAPSFYHFASYAGAAAFARILDQPGLALAAAVWLPLGFLAMLCGGYALGARLAGPAGGIAALAGLALLPDASNYGLRNGWFSFHWTLFAHAGAAYALGAAFLSLALLDRWHAERSRAALIASLLLALSTLFFRAQVLALYLPVWIATAAVCSVPRSTRRTAWLMLAILGIGAAAASLLVAQLGHWRLGAPALVEFLWYVHTGHEPTAYGGVYAHLRSMYQPGIVLVAGIALVFAAALGAFVVALPAAALVARGTGALRPIDAAAGYLVFCWLLLVLFAPTPWHGDPSDFTHRSFVLLYAACAIWTLCLAIRTVEKPLWAGVFAFALLAMPALIVSADGMARPKFRWGEAETAVPVAPGLAQAAAFLRRHAAAGDIFAAAGLSEAFATYDLSTQLCALSGMPAYLSRPYVEMLKDARRKAVVTTRLGALQKLEELTEFQAAMQSLGTLNIRWYVVAGEQGPRWDPARARAAFKSGTVALYRTP